MSSPTLFEPFVQSGLRLANRLVRSATAERMADASGIPDDRQVGLYRRLSAGGVGLIITGHAYVRRDGKCHPEMMALDDDRVLPRLEDLVVAAHEGGSAIAVQINHGGRNCDPTEVARPVAPSAIPASERRPVPAELTSDGIREVVADFGRAAERVRHAGCDAVQVHAAHGYLVSQFLSPLANRRADRYGGALENRARLLREIVASVRSAVGTDFPVLVKLGVTDNLAGGLTAEEGALVAAWLDEWHVDAVEVSTGLRGAIRTGTDGLAAEAYLLPLALEVRRRTDVPLALVGGIRSLATMERILERGIDLVSICRPLIREPDLPRLLRSGAVDGSSCRSCGRCWPIGAGEGISCKREEGD